MAENSDLERIWMVITPHNPFKKKSSLLDNLHRYQMVQRALEEYPNIEASTIEFDLPQPNYTVNTWQYLKRNILSMSLFDHGEDNLKSLHKWKNFEVILNRYDIYVYPRISEVK